jgi:predicted DCC family thiol-disulfide oxidoreductase YuxK
MSEPTNKRLITVFYDGHCGLCHGFVRFLLTADGSGNKFDFAPLQGDYFIATIAAAKRINLPDSIVVQDEDGNLLLRSSAVLYVFARLGGFWRLLASLARLLPRSLLDRCYDGVARVRLKLFRVPAETCPLVPPNLRARFRT